jgi:subtilase family serine protease
VLVANNLVQCGQTEINSSTLVLGKCPAGSTGKGEVSMSWGTGEYIGENASDGCANLDDSCFTTPGVVYFASAGDGPGVIWPGVSPNVVCAGGTTNRRNNSNFNFLQEAAWVDGGGGVSAIETKPSYQSPVSNLSGTTMRAVPDLSFDADPYTGVYVYDTFPVEGLYYYEWMVVGGTSVSSPALAGIVNRAGAFAASSSAELTTIYTNRLVAADITDITNGFCGFYMGFSTATGYDFCTGVGVPNTYAGK